MISDQQFPESVKIRWRCEWAAVHFLLRECLVDKLSSLEPSPLSSENLDGAEEHELSELTDYHVCCGWLQSLPEIVCVLSGELMLNGQEGRGTSVEVVLHYSHKQRCFKAFSVFSSSH